jgi:hypothetical protein
MISWEERKRSPKFPTMAESRKRLRKARIITACALSAFASIMVLIVPFLHNEVAETILFGAGAIVFSIAALIATDRDPDYWNFPPGI